MKRFSALSLIAVLMATILLLSSCGLGVSSLKFKKILDPEATYDKFDPATAAAVATTLKDLEVEDDEGDLVYLTGSTEVAGVSQMRHVVYNLKTGSIVLDLTESGDATNGVEYEIELESFDNEYEDEDVAFFYVLTNTITAGEDNETTTLYDAAGTSIDSATGEAWGEENIDLFLFDDVLYRVAGGQFTKLRDQSPFTLLPEIDKRYGDYYYYFDDAAIEVYDLNLKSVASLELPGYADTFMMVLGNGNVLYQYLVSLPESSEDYDALLMDNGEAYPVNIVTEILKVKNGKTKSVDTDYHFRSSGVITPDDCADAGLVADKVYGMIAAVEIKDGIIDGDASYQTTKILYVEKDGDLLELPEIDGESVGDLYIAADGRWAAYTMMGHKYLLDAEGEVLGELSNASIIDGTYIKANDGKIYDMSLNMLLDYEEQKLEYEAAYGQTLIFSNEDDEVLIWNGSGTPTAIVPKDSETLSIAGGGDWGYVIKNTTNNTCTAYAFNGTTLFTVTADTSSYFYTSTVATSDSAYLVEVNGTTDGTVFYRLAR